MLLSKATESLITALKNNDLTNIKKAIYDGAELDVWDDWGRTLIVYATSKEAASLLLDNGLFFNKGEGDSYKSLLHDAKTEEVIDLLIDLGVDVNIKDRDGFTALHEAASEDRISVAKALLKHNIEVDAMGMDGFTALHFATSVKMALLLVNSGSDLRLIDDPVIKKGVKEQLKDS